MPSALFSKREQPATVTQSAAPVPVAAAPQPPMFQIQAASGTFTARFDAVTAWVESQRPHDFDSRLFETMVYLDDGQSRKLRIVSFDFDTRSFTQIMQEHYGDAFDGMFLSQIKTDDRFTYTVPDTRWFVRADHITSWFKDQYEKTILQVRGNHQLAFLSPDVLERLAASLL